MTWFTRHPSRELGPYSDGQLEPGRSRAVAAHLAVCARCRAEVDDMRFAAGLVRQLATVTPPASVWTAIDRAVEGKKVQTSAPFFPWPFFVPMRWATAAVLVLAAVGGIAYWYAGRTTGAWQVSHLDGGATAHMAAGEWVETSQSSRARITVGAIGTVDVEPGTRVQLGAVQSTEYRIALARGTISARITAPPRLFIVDTPTSTVVDLGCAYTMQVDESGAGELRMTEGWASLEWGGRESLVPAGALCRTRPRVGPGTPFFEDATIELQQALAAFDFADGGVAALAIVMPHARVRDTLTLWHLLSRVDANERGLVYDRIAELTPPPPGVARDKALQLDPATLKVWREELAWTW